jgi:hypothetical protein
LIFKFDSPDNYFVHYFTYKDMPLCDMEYGSSCEPEDINEENEGTYVSTFDRIIITCYFTLTTLSTVGYGDFYPVSIGEKIVGSII